MCGTTSNDPIEAFLRGWLEKSPPILVRARWKDSWRGSWQLQILTSTSAKILTVLCWSATAHPARHGFVLVHQQGVSIPKVWTAQFTKLHFMLWINQSWDEEQSSTAHQDVHKACHKGDGCDHQHDLQELTKAHSSTTGPNATKNTTCHRLQCSMNMRPMHQRLRGQRPHHGWPMQTAEAALLFQTAKYLHDLHEHAKDQHEWHEMPFCTCSCSPGACDDASVVCFMLYPKKSEPFENHQWCPKVRQ